MHKLVLINIVQTIIFIIISSTDAVPLHEDYEGDFDKYYKSYHPRNGLNSYSSLLRDLATYKRKLQLLGHYPVVYETAPGTLEQLYYPRQELPAAVTRDDDVTEQESITGPPHDFYEPSAAATEENSHDFNDLEVLQLIPVIVEQLKQGSVTPQEEGVLKSIFGDLWSIIVDEASRPENDPVHPLLDILLKSNEIKHNKRDVSYENDVAQNTVDLKERNMSPSDQLLHRTWSIVSRSMLQKNENKVEEKVKRKIKQRKERKLRKMKNRRKQMNSMSTDLLEPTNEVFAPEVNFVPRQKRISRRHKRSFHITRSDDLSRMKALVNYLNAHEDDNNEDDDDGSSEELSFGYTDGIENYKRPTYNHPSIYELFHLAEQHRRRRQNKF